MHVRITSESSHNHLGTPRMSRKPWIGVFALCVILFIVAAVLAYRLSSEHFEPWPMLLGGSSFALGRVAWRRMREPRDAPSVGSTVI